jgi:hypothetical protein
LSGGVCSTLQKPNRRRLTIPDKKNKKSPKIIPKLGIVWNERRVLTAIFEEKILE